MFGSAATGTGGGFGMSRPFNVGSVFDSPYKVRLEVVGLITRQLVCLVRSLRQEGLVRSGVAEALRPLVVLVRLPLVGQVIRHRHSVKPPRVPVPLDNQVVVVCLATSPLEVPLVEQQMARLCLFFIHQ